MIQTCSDLCVSPLLGSTFDFVSSRWLFLSKKSTVRDIRECPRTVDCVSGWSETTTLVREIWDCTCKNQVGRSRLSGGGAYDRSQFLPRSPQTRAPASPAPPCAGKVGVAIEGYPFSANWPLTGSTRRVPPVNGVLPQGHGLIPRGRQTWAV